MLGSIVQYEMYPNSAGAIAKSIWDSLPGRFAHVGLDVYCMMPNHLHGILVLEERSKGSLGEIVRVFKAATTRQIRTAGMLEFAWQNDFYEHIVRNEKDLARIRQYILDNPARWAEDRFYKETR